MGVSHRYPALEGLGSYGAGGHAENVADLRQGKALVNVEPLGIFGPPSAVASDERRLDIRR